MSKEIQLDSETLEITEIPEPELYHAIGTLFEFEQAKGKKIALIHIEARGIHKETKLTVYDLECVYVELPKDARRTA